MFSKAGEHNIFPVSFYCYFSKEIIINLISNKLPCAIKEGVVALRWNNFVVLQTVIIVINSAFKLFQHPQSVV